MCARMFAEERDEVRLPQEAADSVQQEIAEVRIPVAGLQTSQGGFITPLIHVRPRLGETNSRPGRSQASRSSSGQSFTPVAIFEGLRRSPQQRPHEPPTQLELDYDDTAGMASDEMKAAVRAVIAEVGIATKDDLALLTTRVSTVERNVQTLPSLVHRQLVVRMDGAASSAGSSRSGVA